MDSNFSANKFIKVTVTILVITLFSFLIGYWGSKNSDAFHQAQKFIRQSHTVNSELGSVTDVQLMPFGYQVEFAGNSGTASFDCDVIGSKAKGEVVIRLMKTFDAWQVTAATLQVNGHKVSLL